MPPKRLEAGSGKPGKHERRRWWKSPGVVARSWCPSGATTRNWPVTSNPHSAPFAWPRRLLDAYESTAPEPLTRDEHRWLPGALALVPLHWAATAGLVGDGIREAESAMTAAEAWWSRRAELSS